MEIVKKLSVGKLIGAFKSDLPAEGSLTLGNVVGIARGTKTGESQYGPWTALTGDFLFVPTHGANKGKQFRSGVLFVPDVVLDLVLPVVLGLDKGGAVEIAFAIKARKDETTTVGYSYAADFLKAPEPNDPLAALTALALPAPEATDADGETGEPVEADPVPAAKSKGK